ncbi:MAG: hypothetical protein Q9179_007220 [Wetmoreana sp. 5 TL-2023]
MYSSLMYNIKSAGFWNPAVPSHFKATATNIVSQWVHQPAVVAAVSTTAAPTAPDLLGISRGSNPSIGSGTSTSSLYSSSTSRPITVDPETSILQQAHPIQSIVFMQPPTSSTAKTGLAAAATPKAQLSNKSVSPIQSRSTTPIEGLTSTLPQAPSSTQSLSPTPTPTSAPNWFQRLDVTAKAFTILGVITGVAVPVVIFILTRRRQQRKKQERARQNGHTTADSDVGDEEQEGTANAMNHGNGNAVSGNHNSNRARYHYGDRNRYYGPVFGPGFQPQPNHLDFAAPQPSYQLQTLDGRSSTAGDTWTPTSVSPSVCPHPAHGR